MGCRDDALSQDEFDELYEQAEELQDRIILLMLGEAGLRAGELANLTKRSFKWQEGDLICGSKTEAGRRTLPLRDLLPELWKLCAKWYAVHQTIGLDRTNIWRRVKKLAKQTALTNNVYPHALRSTAGTKLAYKFKNPFALQDWMGWKDIQTAMFYIRKSGVMLKQAVKEATA